VLVKGCQYLFGVSPINYFFLLLLPHYPLRCLLPRRFLLVKLVIPRQMFLPWLNLRRIVASRFWAHRIASILVQGRLFEDNIVGNHKAFSNGIVEAILRGSIHLLNKYAFRYHFVHILCSIFQNQHIYTSPYPKRLVDEFPCMPKLEQCKPWLNRACRKLIVNIYCCHRGLSPSLGALTACKSARVVLMMLGFALSPTALD